MDLNLHRAPSIGHTYFIYAFGDLNVLLKNIKTKVLKIGNYTIRHFFMYNSRIPFDYISF